MHLRLFLTVAAFVARPAKAQARPRAILGCTTSSFSIPSWFVHNFTHTLADGSSSFRVQNRATNYTADLVCGGRNKTTRSAIASTVSSNCTIRGHNSTTATAARLQAQVHVENGTASVQMSQRWSCDDRHLKDPIPFAAAGSTLLQLRCTASACTADHPLVLVRGSLQEPVALTPRYAQGPAGHAVPGCRAAGAAPEWLLQSVYYLNQTGDDGATALTSQTLMLQVVNRAIGYQAGCTGFLPDNLATTPTAFNCTGQGFDFVGKDHYRVQTQALFEPATFRFTLRQTWYCDEGDAARPVSIETTGSMVLPLHCTSVPVYQGEQVVGNKTTCLSGSSSNTTSTTSTTSTTNTTDIVLHGQPGTVTPLPPFSIEDPLPTPDGCTVTSLVAPRWSFSGFEIDTSDSAGSTAPAGSATVGFNVKLVTGTNADSFPISIYQADDGSSQWHNCTFGAGEAPLAPYRCAFLYEAATKRLTLSADWICSDLDETHPIQFSGVARTTVDKSLSCSTFQGQTQCFMDEGVSWEAPITNVTWQGSEKNVLAL